MEKDYKICVITRLYLAQIDSLKQKRIDILKAIEFIIFDTNTSMSRAKEIF